MLSPSDLWSRIVGAPRIGANFDVALAKLEHERHEGGDVGRVHMRLEIGRAAPDFVGEPGILQEFFDRWVSPRRTATIADLQRGKNASELRSEAEPELLNDAIFGAIYYRLLLRSGPLTRRFGEELVEQVIRGHRSS
jgi:Tetracyclin repressor-like, C-terminal domain